MIRRAVCGVSFFVFASLSQHAVVHAHETNAAAVNTSLPTIQKAAPERVGDITRDRSGKIVRRIPKDAAAFLGETNTFHFMHGRNFRREADILQRKIDAVIAMANKHRRLGAALDGRGLTKAEQNLVRQLQKTDAAVRQHEMKHYLTGRPYTGIPEYWYVVGPDKRRYIMAGVTPFHFSPEEASVSSSLQKLKALRRAALAPWHPSATDRQAAAYLDRLIDKLTAKD